MFYISFQHNKIEILVTINKTVLMNLCITRPLYYHSNFITSLLSRKVTFVSCQVHNITVNDSPDFSLLYINYGSKKNFLNIENSMFYQIMNINSIIFIKEGFDIEIRNCSFSHNHVMNILKDYLSDGTGSL